MRIPMLLFCCAGALAGCGGGNDKLAPVSGVIKQNGKPLEGATVTFRPLGTEDKNAPTSFGKTDAEGRFTLEVATGERGAYVGKHRVTIEKQTEVDSANDVNLGESQIPPKYNDDSKLEFEVTKEGSAEANWDLKVPKGYRRKLQSSTDD